MPARGERRKSLLIKAGDGGLIAYNKAAREQITIMKY